MTEKCVLNPNSHEKIQFRIVYLFKAKLNRDIVNKYVDKEVKDNIKLVYELNGLI